MVNTYPGSKAGSGVWQKIISQMLAHENYFELFLGHGAVMLRKRPAPALNVGCDIDRNVVAWWAMRDPQPSLARLTILRTDAMDLLSSNPAMQDPKTLVYLDPPYLRATRTRNLYLHEFGERSQHVELIDIIRPLPCMVMISGYWSDLYIERLGDWRAIAYNTMTRGGLREEFLWMNFPAGLPLHDTRFVGEGFRERERIGRKKKRWRARLAAMPAAERQVIREALEDVGR